MLFLWKSGRTQAVLTVRFYHDSTKPEDVQALLENQGQIPVTKSRPCTAAQAADS
jgi:hypothetical protein